MEPESPPRESLAGAALAAVAVEPLSPRRLVARYVIAPGHLGKEVHG